MHNDLRGKIRRNKIAWLCVHSQLIVVRRGWEPWRVNAGCANSNRVGARSIVRTPDKAQGATMRRILVVAMAMMAAVAVPVVAQAAIGGAAHMPGGKQSVGDRNSDVQQVRRGGRGGHFRGGGFRGGRHFRGGGRHFRGGGWRGGRHWRGGRRWAGRGYYRGGRHWRGGRYYGGRRYWGGRWWAYGVGSCWRWSPYYDRFVWVCY
jgi:hypothetical protein